MRNVLFVILAIVVLVLGIKYFTGQSDVNNLSGWREEGRVIEQFGGTVPPALQYMPVESNPSQIIKSYSESMAGDASRGEPSHIQYTYIYASTKTGEKITSEFETYLKKDGYVTEKTVSDDKLSYGLHGRKGEEVIANVTTSPRNQFEQLVTVSLIFIEKPQNIQ